MLVKKMLFYLVMVYFLLFWYTSHIIRRDNDNRIWWSFIIAHWYEVEAILPELSTYYR